MTQKPKRCHCQRWKWNHQGDWRSSLVATDARCAGGAGYWFGTIQRMAPVEMVGPGTPGAKPAAPNTVTKAADNKPEATEEEQLKKLSLSRLCLLQVKSMERNSGSRQADLITLVIRLSVNVNDQDVDNFFAPGKAVDITRLLKKGDNSITFNAKELDEKFNAHKGDESKKLVLNLISGPTISENFKPADVVLSYQRNASQTDNDTQTLKFTKSN